MNIGDKMQQFAKEIDEQPKPEYTKKPAEYRFAARADVERSISSKYRLIDDEEEKKTSISSKEHTLFAELRDAVIKNNKEKIDEIKQTLISGKAEMYRSDIQIEYCKQSIENAAKRLDELEEASGNHYKTSGKVQSQSPQYDDDDYTEPTKKEPTSSTLRDNIFHNARTFASERKSPSRSEHFSSDSQDEFEYHHRQRRSRKTEKK